MWGAERSKHRQNERSVCKNRMQALLTANCCVAWILRLHKGHVNQITSDQGCTARALSPLSASPSFGSFSLSAVHRQSSYLSIQTTTQGSPQRLNRSEEAETELILDYLYCSACTGNNLVVKLRDSMRGSEKGKGGVRQE